jgi:1-acyl-sn-glycerol-3-phosphate acyltransferase
MDTEPQSLENRSHYRLRPLPAQPPGVAPARHEQLAELAEINTDDIVASLGLEHVRRGRTLLRKLCHGPASRLARQVLAFDSLVSAAGLQTGGAWMLGQFVRSFVVEGQRCLPPAGPLLIVSNHPGLYDTLALFSAINRSDVQIIAADRPFLRALPATMRHLITIDERAASVAARMGVVRAATRHMRAGGALLTFPGGRIEPDPAVLPGAIDALRAWSDSLELFIRLVPGVTVVPVVVSGVLSPVALRHPLTRLRREKDKQEWLAAMLQVVFPSLQSGTVRVAFGQPLRWPADAPLDSQARARQVIAETRRVMEHCVR